VFKLVLYAFKSNLCDLSPLFLRDAVTFEADSVFNAVLEVLLHVVKVYMVVRALGS
jgi:hypothetical protein